MQDDFWTYYEYDPPAYRSHGGEVHFLNSFNNMNNSVNDCNPYTGAEIVTLVIGDALNGLAFTWIGIEIALFAWKSKVMKCERFTVLPNMAIPFLSQRALIMITFHLFALSFILCGFTHVSYMKYLTVILVAHLSSLFLIPVDTYSHYDWSESFARECNAFDGHPRLLFDSCSSCWCNS